MIAAVVLGAGGSKRLGQPKQLLERGGRSLVRNAVEAAVGGGCRPVIVVLGAESERVRAAIDDPRVVTRLNPDWEDGIASSIRTGIAALRGLERDVEAAVLTACDQPRLSPAVIRRLIDAYRDRVDRTIAMAACTYAGTRGTPALFGRERFDRLLGLHGDRGAQSLLRAGSEPVLEVAWPDGELDIDRPEDAARHGRRR